MVVTYCWMLGVGLTLTSWVLSNYMLCLVLVELSLQMLSLYLCLEEVPLLLVVVVTTTIILQPIDAIIIMLELGILTNEEVM